MSAICRLDGPGDEPGTDLGIEFTPNEDETLDVDVWDDEGNRVELYIDRSEALQLFHALGDWLIATAPTPDDQAEAQGPPQSDPAP